VKVRKELWFGFIIMAMIAIPVVLFTPWTNLTNGHLGLLMLALIVIAIMLGFPTAFTLMGMGVFFAWLAYRSADPEQGGGAHAGPVRAALLRGHVERRPDCDPAVCVHGIPGGARGPDRPAVQEPAPRARARAGIARRRNDRDLRHLRYGRPALSAQW
jgi:hypothetical protein